MSLCWIAHFLGLRPSREWSWEIEPGRRVTVAWCPACGELLDYREEEIPAAAGETRGPR